MNDLEQLRGVGKLLDNLWDSSITKFGKEGSKIIRKEMEYYFGKDCFKNMSEILDEPIKRDGQAPWIEQVKTLEEIKGKERVSVFIESKEKQKQLICFLENNGFEIDLLHEKNQYEVVVYLDMLRKKYDGWDEVKHCNDYISVDDFILIYKEKVMSKKKMTTGEKISELLSYGHQVLFKSDDTEELLIVAEVDERFITCGLDGYESDDEDKEYFDNEDNSVIKIYKRKLKRLKENDEIYDLYNEAKTKIAEDCNAEEYDQYGTEDVGCMHITHLAPAWYSEDEIETIEIAGRKYDKKEFEKAVEDLEEIE